MRSEIVFAKNEEATNVYGDVRRKEIKAISSNAHLHNVRRLFNLIISRIPTRARSCNLDLADCIAIPRPHGFLLRGFFFHDLMYHKRSLVCTNYFYVFDVNRDY